MTRRGLHAGWRCMSYNVAVLPAANVSEFKKASLDQYRWDVVLLQEPGPVDKAWTEAWNPHLVIRSSHLHAIIIHSSVKHLLAHFVSNNAADVIYF